MRDAEWVVRRADMTSGGNYQLACTGVSEIVRDRQAVFLSELERIKVLEPENTRLVPDRSPAFADSLLYMESRLRQNDEHIHIGHGAAMDLVPYQLEPARQVHYYDKTIISINTLKQDAECRTYLENAYTQGVLRSPLGSSGALLEQTTTLQLGETTMRKAILLVAAIVASTAVCEEQEVDVVKTKSETPQNDRMWSIYQSPEDMDHPNLIVASSPLSVVSVVSTVAMTVACFEAELFVTLIMNHVSIAGDSRECGSDSESWWVRAEQKHIGVDAETTSVKLYDNPGYSPRSLQSLRYEKPRAFLTKLLESKGYTIKLPLVLYNGGVIDKFGQHIGAAALPLSLNPEFAVKGYEDGITISLDGVKPAVSKVIAVCKNEAE